MDYKFEILGWGTHLKLQIEDKKDPIFFKVPIEDYPALMNESNLK